MEHRVITVCKTSKFARNGVFERDAVEAGVDVVKWDGRFELDLIDVALTV